MTRWALIVAGVGSEVTAALSMKAATEQPWVYLIAVASYAAANVFLVLVLRRGMTIGFAYGIVGALTVAGTAISSSFLFAETLSRATWVGLGMVAVGVFVVHASADPMAASAADRGEQ